MVDVEKETKKQKPTACRDMLTVYSTSRNNYYDPSLFRNVWATH
jgi:hypothetical protein